MSLKVVIDRGKVKEMYLNGDSGARIAKEFKISTPTVYKILREMNVEIKSSTEAARKYSLNETVFDILTEASAYWIGFIMADGCVTKADNANRCLKLSLALVDIEHVNKFKTFLETDKPIKIYKAKTSFGEFENASLSIYSETIMNKLERFGVTSKKSLTAKTIGLEADKNYWRGVIDGDGCLGITKKNKPYISLVGSEDTLKQYLEFVKSHVKTNAKIIHRRGHNCFYITFNSKIAYRVIKLLYENSKIYLDRKNEVALKIIRDFIKYDGPPSTLVGFKFTRLLVLSETERKNKVRQWLCRCDCGEQKIVGQAELKCNKTKSCGCLKSETSRKMINTLK